MRLIDADALTMLLHNNIDGLDEEFPNDKQVNPYISGVKMALSFIDISPTIDAVPVVKTMNGFTQSAAKFFFDKYPQEANLFMFGHTEAITEKMCKEYIEWCQTDEGRSYMKGGANYKGDGVLKQTITDISHAPTIDAVPVVMCKDCKWWTKQEASIQGRCALAGIYPTGGWYCGNGKREDNE